jgi:transposase-like protein
VTDGARIQVQAVAAALDIHPFMLSKWRKQVRDGVLRGKGRTLTAAAAGVGAGPCALAGGARAPKKRFIRFCSVERRTSSRSSRPKRTRMR